MTYTKPNLFELGNVQTLVLGDDQQFYIESELSTTANPLFAEPCQLEGGGQGVETIVGCQPA